MRTKSLLLTPFLLLLSGVTFFAIYAAATGPATLAWIGVAMAAAPLPAMVTYLMATEKIARTSANLPSAFAFSGLGFIFTIVGFAGVLQPIMAFGAMGVLAWYIFVYSRYGRSASKSLKMGEVLPAFTLERADGAIIPSTAFLQQPTLLLFYRGNWCPLCMAQIREVADAYKRLTAQGVEVVMVSPQPADETEKLAKKFDVPFKFLIDRDLKAARTLDIFAQGGTPLGVDAMGYGTDTVLPTVVATDHRGRIIFLDQTDNYRVRPEPETFLAIFEANGDPIRPTGNPNSGGMARDIGADVAGVTA